MRSSPAQASEDLLARLFTDAEFRARFRRNPQAMGRELGLDPAALAALENTDWVGLELAARSYARKRDATLPDFLLKKLRRLIFRRRP